MKLKVGLVAPIWVRVPPTAYGGIELIVSLLADGLVERGHDVTLFATADAQTKAKVVSVFDHPQTNQIGMQIPDIYHVGAAYQFARDADFDIINDHTFSAPVLGQTVPVPVLATIHGEYNDLTSRYYMKFKDSIYYNTISNHQVESLPDLRYVKPVHNTIDFSSIKVEPRKQGYLLSLGRVSPVKGTHIAIEIAKKLERPLVLAGKIDPGSDERYFRTRIEPEIDGRLIRFLGEVSEAQKRSLMAKASCFLFPIQWAEPFGLVMLEAMAAGTPVVAFNRGAAAEVIKPGVSGFVAESQDEMAALVRQADQLDPYLCRAHVEETFPVEKMIDGYVDNYMHILRSEERIGHALSTG